MNPQYEPPTARAILLFALLLLCSAAMQSLLAARVSFLGGEPDFLLTLTAVAAILSDGSAGAVTGFAGGLFTASLAGQTVGTYIVSRTIAGWCAGWAMSRFYRANAFVVVLGTLVASVLSEVVYLLAAPRLSLGHGLKTSLVGAAWNAILAYPTMLILRRCGWGEQL